MSNDHLSEKKRQQPNYGQPTVTLMLENMDLSPLENEVNRAKVREMTGKELDELDDRTKARLLFAIAYETANKKEPACAVYLMSGFRTDGALLDQIRELNGTMDAIKAVGKSYDPNSPQVLYIELVCETWEKVIGSPYGKGMEDAMDTLVAFAVKHGMGKKVFKDDPEDHDPENHGIVERAVEDILLYVLEHGSDVTKAKEGLVQRAIDKEQEIKKEPAGSNYVMDMLRRIAERNDMKSRARADALGIIQAVEKKTRRESLPPPVPSKSASNGRRALAMA